MTNRKRIFRTDKKDTHELLNEVKRGLDVKELRLAAEYAKDLPAFKEDGSVALYEVNGRLLGKGALMKFLESISKLK